MTPARPPFLLADTWRALRRMARIAIAAERWARAYRGHHPGTTMGQPDPTVYVVRAEFRERERELLAAVEGREA